MPKSNTSRAAKAEPDAKEPEQTAPAAGENQPQADADPLWVMGQVCTLMAVSPGHKHLALADLEWLVMPAISSRQFRLFRGNGQPIGFISWAFLDDEAELRLRRPRPYLRPADWRSGPKCWLVDLVAPFGHAEAILSELREHVLPGIEIHTLNGVLGANGQAPGAPDPGAVSRMPSVSPRAEGDHGG